MMNRNISGMAKKMFHNHLLTNTPKFTISEITDELQFTPNFYEAINDRLKDKGPGSFLRLEIFAGEGCEGFTYKFKFDSSVNEEEDYVKRITQISENGEPKDWIVFAVSGDDVKLLKGATIDYSQEMMREIFYVKQNPNAEISCSCKTSFSPKSDLF